MTTEQSRDADVRLTPKQVRRLRRLAVIGVVLTVFGVLFRAPLFQGNFGAVDPGRVYRSAQPTSNFEETIRARGLKSVLNLRGGSRRDEFYRQECEVANRLGVDFYDIPISATKRPSRRDLMLAIAVLDRCEYPLLIHCKWGSDRTGMVSALYRMLHKGELPEIATTSFSIAHGHIPLFGPQKLHEPFAEYANWLKAKNLTHDRERFLQWVAHEYRSPDAFEGWPSVEQGPRRMSLAPSKSQR